MNTNGYSTWLEIDLGVIRNNVNRLFKICNPKGETNISSLPKTAVMAVVKADGYGHGAFAVAKAAVQAGATWCGVARLDEALNLRRSGINCRILVLGYTPPDRIPDVIANNVTLTVYDLNVAKNYGEKALSLGDTVKVHVKVDTGMGRLGMRPPDALQLLTELGQRQGLVIEGLFTHFARADEPDNPTTSQQLQKFKDLIAALNANGLRPKIIHTANSSATIHFPEAHFDLVRPGIAMLGIDPSSESPLPEEFRPALTWKALLTSTKMLPPRHGISYGHTYFTQTEECIGVVPVGYADGFRRVPGNVVLIENQLVPVVGNISMDQTMVRLENVPKAQIGSEVVLIGKQGNRILDVNEHARHWGTISYEVVCGLADRLPRIYLNEKVERT